MCGLLVVDSVVCHVVCDASLRPQAERLIDDQNWTLVKWPVSLNKLRGYWFFTLIKPACRPWFIELTCLLMQGTPCLLLDIASMARGMPVNS